MSETYWQTREDGLSLTLRVQPRSSLSRLELTPEGALKARVTAPPVDSAANEACLALLAEVLRVPRGRVRLLQGQKSRTKVFVIEGPPTELLTALQAHLGG